MLLVLLSITLVAVVPQRMNYQGKLTDPTGVAIDGSRNIVFRIFNSPTGGTPLWSETRSIDVSKGLFDVVLGEINPLVLPFDVQYYIELVVEGEALVPRNPLSTTPYAFRAAVAESLAGSASVQDTMIAHWDSIRGIPDSVYSGTDNDWRVVGDDMHSIPSGKVGIGTAAPWAKLQVESSTVTAISAHNTGGMAGLFLGRETALQAEADYTVTGSTAIYAAGGRAATIWADAGWNGSKAVYGFSGYGGSWGIYGEAEMGVFGKSYWGTGSQYGVAGEGRWGVKGIARSFEAPRYAIYGDGSTTDAGVTWAGFFVGDVHTSGKVGIGTENPQRKLEVRADGTYTGAGGGQIRISGETDERKRLELGFNTTEDVGFIQSYQNTGTTKPLILNPNTGNVGIHNSAPAEALHVTGNIRASSLAGSGNRMVQANSSGNLVPLSAGTTSEFLRGDGTWAVPSGSGSGWSLTGNSGTLDGTNFLGTTDNIPLNLRVNNQKSGRISPSSTYGDVFLGYQAGNSTTSQRCTFIGYQAGAANSTGAYNTAVGYMAFTLNTTGEYNTAFGQQALRNNNGGNRNTALGMEALIYNTTGSYNTSVGTFSTYVNNTGSYNTALGYYALYGTAASCNTAVGYQAGDNNSGGSYNTCIGYNADLGSTSLVNSTAIGNDAVANSSNEMRLGNSSVTSLYCQGAYTATTTSAPNMFVASNGQIMRSTASGGGSGWSLTGNSGTTPGTNFLGTTDANDLVMKINNLEAFRIYRDATYQKQFALGGFNVNGFGSTILEDLEFRTESQTGLMISQFNNYSWGNTSPEGPVLKLARARGSSGSPTYLTSGDWLGQIIFTAPAGSIWPESYFAAIASQARASSGNRAADLRFYTVSSTEGGNFWNYERMRIGNGGGLGININTGGGNSDPTAYLHVYGGIGIGPASNAISLTHGVRNSIQIATDTQYGGSNDDHSGYLIYSTMPGGWGTSELHFAGSNDWGSYNTTTPSLILRGTTTSSPYIAAFPNIDKNPIAYAWYVYSDERLKSNFTPLGYGLDEVLRLRPEEFDLHSSSAEKGILKVENSSRRTFGFRAQKLFEQIPELVAKPSDETSEVWSVNYALFAPILVKAIQEQQAKIDSLEAENEALKSRLARIESKLGLE